MKIYLKTMFLVISRIYRLFSCLFFSLSVRIFFSILVLNKGDYHRQKGLTWINVIQPNILNLTLPGASNPSSELSFPINMTKFKMSSLLKFVQIILPNLVLPKEFPLHLLKWCALRITDRCLRTKTFEIRQLRQTRDENYV